ncbi:L-histidine N(alpha)-methyltransferase [Rivularia sp. UHCC 0363]|uniref:L-histidine N(alpha)-methyltransferase n=1 Tax=Rivularia sp. UHCC 0363 TaxID=3110244 RepID=UPI002B1EE795|nr:L-histidine N(alpha)-methyltransferase [Rivularia sp. UHCC 0363]MEA5596618.1 L-histidine N(alpha)-methyltransferase [Rivularia sp. UHCC 0363]
MTFSKAISASVGYSKSVESRLKIQHLQQLTIASPDGSDVVKGLTHNPKYLSPRYFYDDRGSELFEEICELPEYYVTRTETSILQNCAEEIADITGESELIELGSGSSTKTRILLDAYHKKGYPLRYLPIDVSAGILEASARQLLVDYPSLQVHALAGTYEQALEQLQPSELPSRTIGFIGSTLGNLNPQECDNFLSQITAALQLGEYFLLGVDLRKPKHILEAAYDDSAGVTAAFNLNMLNHLNRRFDGNFDLSKFEHWAFYNETKYQIEMHLRSLESQSIELRSLNLKVNFDPGETINTEISRKFDINGIQELLTKKGLVPQKAWTDDNKWFGLILSKLS